MIKIILKKLLDQSGAMDKILVTLLLIVVGVAGVVGLTNWGDTQKETIQSSAESRIVNVQEETSANK